MYYFFHNVLAMPLGRRSLMEGHLRLNEKTDASQTLDTYQALTCILHLCALPYQIVSDAVLFRKKSATHNSTITLRVSIQVKCCCVYTDLTAYPGHASAPAPQYCASNDTITTSRKTDLWRGQDLMGWKLGSTLPRARSQSMTHHYLRLTAQKT